MNQAQNVPRYLYHIGPLYARHSFSSRGIKRSTASTDFHQGEQAASRVYFSRTLRGALDLVRAMRWRQAPGEASNQPTHGQVVLKVDRTKFKDAANVVFYDDPKTRPFGVYTGATVPAEAVVEMIPFDRAGEILNRYAEALVEALLEAKPGSARAFLASLARTRLKNTEFPISLTVYLRDGRVERATVKGMCTPDGGLYISRPHFPFLLRDHTWGTEFWEFASEIVQMSIQEGDASRVIDTYEDDEEGEEPLQRKRPGDVVKWSYSMKMEHYHRAERAAYNED